MTFAELSHKVVSEIIRSLKFVEHGKFLYMDITIEILSFLFLLS